MTDIPEDAWSEAKAIARKAVWADGRGMIGRERNYLEDRVARAILADRAAQAERMARLEEAVNFVARWAWRTDPPHASRKLSDSDRLSCIKHHPTIKRAAKPHIELAEAEAARAALGGNADG